MNQVVVLVQQLNLLNQEILALMVLETLVVLQQELAHKKQVLVEVALVV
jgi:hypothetical protein